MKKIKRKLLIGVSTLMLFSAAFVFEVSAKYAPIETPCQALYGNAAGTAFCCAGSGGGCAAVNC